VNGIVICLPGRGGNGPEWAASYRKQIVGDLPLGPFDEAFNDIRFCGLNAEGGIWYPQPGGPGKSQKAIKGIPKSIKLIEDWVDKLEEQYRIPKNKMILTGFSAGAVMAIQTSLSEKYAGCVVHSGAILEPDELPPCSNNTPYLLTHSQDDKVFTFQNRYLPMCLAMRKRDYIVSTSEQSFGGHGVTVRDAEVARKFILKVLS